MGLRRLRRGRGLAGADRPDRLVGDHDLRQLISRKAGQRAPDLGRNHLVGAIGLPLSELLRARKLVAQMPSASKSSQQTGSCTLSTKTTSQSGGCKGTSGRARRKLKSFSRVYRTTFLSSAFLERMDDGAPDDDDSFAKSARDRPRDGADREAGAAAAC